MRVECCLSDTHLRWQRLQIVDQPTVGCTMLPDARLGWSQPRLENNASASPDACAECRRTSTVVRWHCAGLWHNEEPGPLMQMLLVNHVFVMLLAL
jgi:hypothetical protein